MAITIGLGHKFAAPDDPLGKQIGLGQPAAPKRQSDDWSDVVDTVIAEAVGEGADGMSAVAHVIKNRAASRDLSPGAVVRQPHQFTGYAQPGAGARAAERDPTVRAEAERIVRDAFDGVSDDPTGGADHYHADYVSPDWAQRMPQTARIGRHIFYSSENERRRAPAAAAINQVAPRGGNPEGKGFARLAPPEAEAPTDGGGRLVFAHPDQDKLNDGFRTVLADVSGTLGRDFEITSGYRSPDHPVERAKGNGGGEHTHGTAADINMKGMDEATRAKLVAELQAGGAKRFILYRNSPDMLHVDMKDQKGDGSSWFMFDRSAKNMGAAPSWFRAAAAGEGPSALGRRASNVVVVDEDFQPSDSLGIYAGAENPFRALTPPRQPIGIDSNPLGTKPSGDDALRRDWKAREAAEPGRFSIIPQDELDAWREKWKDEQPSQFMKGLKGAILNSNPEMLGNSLDAMGEIFGSDTLRRAGATVGDWAKQGAWQYQARVGSVADVGDSDHGLLSDFGDYVSFSLGNALGSSAPSLATGVATSAITANPIVGFMAGAAGPSYVQNLGDVYGQMRDNPAIQERVRRGELSQADVAKMAAAAAVPISALDIVGDRAMVGMLGKDVRGGIIKRVVAGAAKGATGEGITEAAQQAIAEAATVAAGGDRSAGDVAVSLVDNAIGGMLGGGAVGAASGTLPSRGTSPEGEPKGGTLAPPTPPLASPLATPQNPTPEAKPAGPLSRAVSSAVERSSPTTKFRITDPAITTAEGEKLPAGELDGQEVTVLEEGPNQVRVLAKDGKVHQVGKRFLEEVEPTPDVQSAGSPSKPAPGAPEGAPAIGATVRVDEEGMEPFMGTVDSYEDGEALIFDSNTGELMQIPLEKLTPLAPPAGEWLATQRAADPSAPGAAPAAQAPAADVQDDPDLALSAPIGAVEQPVVAPPATVDALETPSAANAAPATAEPAPAPAADGASVEMGITPVLSGTTPLNAGRKPRRRAPTPDDIAIAQAALDAADPAMAPLEPVVEAPTTQMAPASEDKPIRERRPVLPRRGARVVVDHPEVGRFSARVESYEEGATEALVKTDKGEEFQIPLDALRINKLTRKEVDAQDLERAPAVPREVQEADKPALRKIQKRNVVMPDVDHAELYDLGRERFVSQKLFGGGVLQRNRVAPAKQAALAEKFGVGAQALGQMADGYRNQVDAAAADARSDTVIRMHPYDKGTLKAARAQASGQVTFKTAKGSTYYVEADGSTTRNKAYRLEHDEAEQGMQPRSQTTFYVTGDEAIALGEFQTRGAKKAVVPLGDGSYGVKYLDGPSEGKIERRTVVTPKVSPEVGLTPVELWKDGTRVHFGNAITEVSQPSAETPSPPRVAPVDIAAVSAATSPVNDLVKPSDAQKKAGNYAKGHVRLAGLDLSIENPAGSTRSGTSRSGKPWSIEMQSHYGYIRRTEGADGDHVDVFVKPGTAELADDAPVFVVDQRNPSKAKGKDFDEHKVMLGFADEAEARAAYMENYTPNWQGLGAITPTSMGEFRGWLKDGDTSKPFAVSGPNYAKHMQPAPAPTIAAKPQQSPKAAEVQRILGSGAGGIVRTRGMGRDLQTNSTLTISAIADDGSVTLVNGLGGLPSIFSLADLKGEVRAGLAFDLVRPTAEKPTIQAEKASASTPPSKPRQRMPKGASPVDRAESYYRIGRRVPSYGGGVDKVLDFVRDGDGFSVRVQGYHRDGRLDGAERVHSTMPSRDELARWEKFLATEGAMKSAPVPASAAAPVDTGTPATGAAVGIDTRTDQPAASPQAAPDSVNRSDMVAPVATGAAGPASTPIARADMEMDTALTAAGREVPVRYAIVEAQSLRPSQTDEGTINPDYPAEMQPRDRSRGASQAQIQAISGKLSPRLLDKGPRASDGAPIIAPDGVVESGNGRTLAIRRAYRTGKAGEYRAYLEAQGYPVAGIKEPVLVRVREGAMAPQERQAFAREANERDTLAMSSTEQAMADAASMKPELLDLYRGGDLDGAGNRDFVRAFARDVVGGNEQARFTSATGDVSQEGLRRIQAAMLGRAYGDPELVAALTESADSNIKAIGGALLDVSPAWALMREEARAGAISPDVDQTARLLEAVRLVNRARREGRKIPEFVDQVDAFSGSALHPVAEGFLRLMFRDDRSWTKPAGRESMASALRFYVDEGRKTAAGVDLLGETAPGADRILGVAKEKQRGQHEPEQQGLAFGSAAAPASRGSAGPAGNAAEGRRTDQQAQERPAGPGSSRADREEVAPRQAGRPLPGKKTVQELLASGELVKGSDLPAAKEGGGPSEKPGDGVAERDPSIQDGEEPAPVVLASAEAGNARAIEDFGEKIEGARKDQVDDFRDQLTGEVDIVAEPLSRVFPQPDYAKLAAAGVDRHALALIAVARERIPPKPRKGWKVAHWSEQVRVLRDFAHSLLDGSYDAGAVKARMKGNAFLMPLANTAEVLAALDPELLPKAAKWSVDSGSFSAFGGQRFEKSKLLYTLRDDQGRYAKSDGAYIQAETLDGIKEPALTVIRSALGQTDAAIPRRTLIGLYGDRASKTVFLGFKGQSGVIRLKSGFATAKDARSYREEHADELQATIDEMRRGPRMRREVNRPREGAARREGDVSPEAFQEAFGFRGVQFGNYVEGERRQFELNEAFDGLMDLAEILAIPPRAISLDGTLGLAFGARGRGGAAKAHYEPGHVVINLTKGKGAGSLAHEWFHAVDHAFARQDSGKDLHVGFMSERTRGEGKTRPEVAGAWRALEKAVRTGPYSRRMADLDAVRSKPYWNTTIEKAARGFERYVVDRLAAKGGTNDYLANIDENAGAYPTPKEMDEGGITAAFDGLFQAIDTRATERGIELYSPASGPVALSLEGVPDDVKEARRAVRELARKRLAGSTVTTADGQNVIINWQGIKHAAIAANRNALAALLSADRLLAASHRTFTAKDRLERDNLVAMHHYEAEASIEGRPVRVVMYVREHADGQRYYDQAVLEEALPGHSGDGAQPGSEPSVQPSGRAEPKIDGGGAFDKVPAGSDVGRTLLPAEMAEIERIVREVSGLDDIRWQRRLQMPAGQAGWANAQPSEAAGVYLTRRRGDRVVQDAVELSMSAATRRTGFHEAFHRIQRLYLNSMEKDVLRAEGPRLRRLVAKNLADPAQAAGMSQKEVEAEAFAMYATKPFRLPSALDAAWRRIAEMTRRVRSWVSGRGFQTAEDVFKAAARGEMRRRPAGEFEHHDADYQAARAVAPVGPSTREGVIDAIRGWWTDKQPTALALVPLNYFADLARPGMTAVADYLRVKRRMDAYRGRKHEAMDVVAQRWLKFARLGKDKVAILSSLMHEATLAGVDPSDTSGVQAADPAVAAELRAKWKSLPPAGQHLFRDVRDAYRAQADELDRILLDNVRKANEIALQKAEAEHVRAMEALAKRRMSAADRKMAIADAEKEHAARMFRARSSSKARMTKLRLAFEASRVQGPYFPLARFGRYFVSVKDVDGTVLSFSRRERDADRKRLVGEMRRAFPHAEVTSGVLAEKGAARDAMDPRMVAELQRMLGNSGIDAETSNAIMDNVWQRWLETLPDLSTRKRFIHRKGTAGFDGDALRAFGSHMFHAAHQMGRLKYGMELQELVNQAADQAEQSDDPVRGMTLANELRKRDEWVRNPEGSAAAQWVTSTMFVWYLAASPAAAIVNLAQTPMVMMPVLAGRFGGFGKASAALLKASADLLGGRGSMANAKLSDEERAALEHFYDSGLIDRTQSHELAGVGETGAAYNPRRAQVMKIISWAFHRAEVVNREVSAIAAYRLARSAGQNVATALDAAHDLVYRGHFDYSNSSRARVLQNDFAKVLGVFQNYQLNTWWRILRDVRDSVKGDTPAARREARYQLAGMAGMMTLMGGVTGLFGYNVMMAIAGVLLDDDDDPFTFKAEMERHVADLFGPDIGDMILRGVPGHLAGLDITGRVGLPDFFVRAPETDAEGGDWVKEMLVGLAGVTGSTLVNFGDSLKLMREGKPMRAIEVSAPKAVKDWMQAYRYANEGILNRKGDAIMEWDQVRAWDVIAELLGFTSAHVAERYERNDQLKDAEQSVLDRRRELMNRFALATQLGDADARTSAIAAIKKFNAMPINRPLAITTESLKRSLATRARNAQKREDGVVIANPALGHTLREMMPEAAYQ